MKTSPRVFLCHSTKDKDFVRRLANDLERLQVSVWLDQWELEVGDSLHSCIGEALVESAYVAVILSPDSVKSHWCKDELEQALASEKREGRKMVLPLICKRVQAPPFLEGRLYLDFEDAYYPALAHLAGIARKTPTRGLLKELAKTPPTTIAECAEILDGAGAQGAQSAMIDGDDYQAIQALLAANGIHVPSDQFTVIPDKIPSDESKLDQLRTMAVVHFDMAWTDPRELKGLDILKKHLDTTSSEQDGADQPATAENPDAEGEENANSPESEDRPQ